MRWWDANVCALALLFVAANVVAGNRWVALFALVCAGFHGYLALNPEK